MRFPTLYSKTKSGKVKKWDICVKDDKTESIVRITTGFVGGAETVFDSSVSSGKNIGRSNETTHYLQAIAEAKSKWNKKKDNGYTEEVGGEVVYISPMLAVDYSTRSHDISFPCYVQPKLDGVRAVYSNKNLFSRKSKLFSNLDFLLEELKKFGNLKIDGELYSDTLPFNELSGLLRKKKLTKDDAQKMSKNIKFVVYDLVSDSDYSDRLQVLRKAFSANKFSHLELIKTEILKSPEDLETFHNKYTTRGYEGVMIRNFLGPYLEKSRSKNLQKFKKFMDSEFEIVGFTEGTGIEAGLVLWVCKVPGAGDATFTVRPTGTHSERAAQFKDAKKYVGKHLTVKYFELFEGVPRFPIGISVRDYE
jgi:DNA ligase-1